MMNTGTTITNMTLKDMVIMTDKKKIVRTYVGRVYTSKFGSSNFIEEELQLDGKSFAEAIDTIKELQAMYETSEYSNIRLEVFYDYSEEKYDHRKIYLMGDREETDEEFAYRLADESRRETEQRIRDERDLVAIAARLGKTVV